MFISTVVLSVRHRDTSANDTQDPLGISLLQTTLEYSGWPGWVVVTAVVVVVMIVVVMVVMIVVMVVVVMIVITWWRQFVERVQPEHMLEREGAEVHEVCGVVGVVVEVVAGDHGGVGVRQVLGFDAENFLEAAPVATCC